MLNFVQYNFILNSLECLLTDVRQRVLIVIMEQVKVKIPNINIEVDTYYERGEIISHPPGNEKALCLLLTLENIS